MSQQAIVGRSMWRGAVCLVACESLVGGFLKVAQERWAPGAELPLERPGNTRAEEDIACFTFRFVGLCLSSSSSPSLTQKLLYFW